MNSRVSLWFFALPIAIALSSQPLHARALPSIVSGDSSTSVPVPDNGIYNITGGYQSTDNLNLFHTFQEFGLNAGEIANFITDPAIANILGRVIGGNPSIIDGLIQVSGGNANLFLMNPAGIVFGMGASLNVPGDFTATTATGIGFGEDRWFNAFGTIAENEYGNLTGNPSEFAFDLANPRAIINLAELTVNNGNLSLLAGTVASTGNLSASNGNLIVAAVPGSSLVRISQPGQLLSLEIDLPRDATGIEWLQLPELLTGSESLENLLVAVDSDPSFPGFGDVWGQAGTAQDIFVYSDRNLTLHGDWQTTGLEGGIALRAGQNLDTFSLNTSSSSGNGGGISLSAGEGLRVNGPLDTSSTEGDAGAISISARGEIETGELAAYSWGNGNGGEIVLTSQWGNIRTQTIATSSEGGSGGNISLSTEGSLFVGEINTSTVEGRGGSVFLNVGEQIAANGAIDTSSTENNAGAIVIYAGGEIEMGDLIARGNGHGGEIVLATQAGNVMTQNIDTSSEGGSGGNISLSTEGSLFVGEITASAGEGRGGSIVLNAGEQITANGAIDTSSTESDAGAISISARGEIETGDLIARGNGHGGEIALATQGGNITTQNVDASGEAGSSGSVSLSAEGALFVGNITAASEEQNGGGIWLFSQSGSIDAGFLDSSSQQGDGGNVDLVASGDIAITALNAEGLNVGGRVHISTDSYFRAMEGFISRDNLFSSISTVGDWAGGDISIYHGGNGEIAFEVGNAGINGTAGAITTGDATISPYQWFESDVREGNITIGTDDPFDDFSNDDSTITATSTTNPAIVTEENKENVEFEENLSEEFDLFVENVESPREELATEIEESVEEHFTEEFAAHLRVGNVERVTPQQAQHRLRDIERQTGIKPALVYALFTAGEPAENSLKAVRKEDGKLLWQSPQNTNSNHQNFLPKRETERPDDRLELVVVTAEGGITRKSLNVTRKQVLDTVREYRRSVTNLRRPSAYIQPARELYQFLIAPIETRLQAQGINNLSFIMDAGLRSVPLAALHDGNQFAIEKYSLGMMPSLSLTDMNYRDLRDRQILAMGAEKFASQDALPAVPVELTMITETLWQGKAYLNEEFTLDNFHAARENGHYNIVHLATHGEFKAGAPGNSYIQFWDRKLALDRLHELKLNNPQVDLLVLSACRTALGDAQAELGFSGLAVMAGVKSALGSLWYVNDEGTLAFMSQFYERLQSHSTKAEALRQAQLAMLQGNIRIEGGQLMTPLGNVDLPPELEGMGDRNLAHPYYWSAFTLIGNPW